MYECDAQPAALVAPCWIIINGYVCVTDTYILHMSTAGWTHARYLIVSVMHEMDTVCVNAMRSLQRLLHPAG